LRGGAFREEQRRVATAPAARKFGGQLLDGSPVRSVVSFRKIVLAELPQTFVGDSGSRKIQRRWCWHEGERRA
jgi:hypothetical protein